MKTEEKIYLIDGPSPFAPIEELRAFRAECLTMLERLPGHGQWTAELKAMDEAIARWEEVRW